MLYSGVVLCTAPTDARLASAKDIVHWTMFTVSCSASGMQLMPEQTDFSSNSVVDTEQAKHLTAVMYELTVGWS